MPSQILIVDEPIVISLTALQRYMAGSCLESLLGIPHVHKSRLSSLVNYDRFRAIEVWGVVAKVLLA